MKTFYRKFVRRGWLSVLVGEWSEQGFRRMAAKNKPAGIRVEV
jgi:hypothetical protein